MREKREGGRGRNKRNFLVLVEISPVKSDV